MEQPASQQKLPAGLAGVLNHPEDQRDSAYFSSQDPSSKHTSTQSSNGGPVPTPPSYQSSVVDQTPSPINTTHYTQPLSSPTGGMSVASMVSPTDTDGQSMHNRFSRQSHEAGSMHAGLNGEDSSRRQSMSSTLGNFNEMTLNGARSPYASNNQSTTSIQSTLQQQRNPGAQNPAARLSNSYAPHNQRLPDALSSPLSPSRHMGGAVPKTAPAITGPALGNIARAPEPTKGQAWAFPEEEVQRLPSAARPSGETTSFREPSYLDSRRSSMADSIASSQFTTESRLPPGQRRLEDGMPSDYVPRESSELQTHHHSLTNKHLADLQGGPGSSNGSQPYSRTPELRVSHKLAERKRRTEMKDLFDTLRDLMPQERGSKASKWEILTKAITEHQRMQRDLNEQRQNYNNLSEQTETARREANTLRLENGQLRHQLTHITAEMARLNGQQPTQAQADQRVNGAPHSAPHKSAELPPIRGPFMADDNMTGVQYHDLSSPQRPSEHRINGFPFGLSPEQSRANGSIYPEAPSLSPYKSYFQPSPQSTAHLNGLAVNKNKHS